MGAPRVNFGPCWWCSRAATKRGYCATHYITARRQGLLNESTRRPIVLDNGWKPVDTELAWAAGFYDGEGSFYKVRSKTCKSGWLPFASVSQSGDTEVLERFLRAVGGLGTIINGPRLIPGYKDQYKVDFAGYQRTQMVAGLLWPWLGSVKKRAAIQCLEDSRG